MCSRHQRGASGSLVPCRSWNITGDSHAVLVLSSLFSALLFLHRSTAVGLGVREERQDSLNTQFFFIKEEVESFYLG